MTTPPLNLLVGVLLLLRSSVIMASDLASRRDDDATRAVSLPLLAQHGAKSKCLTDVSQDQANIAAGISVAWLACAAPSETERFATQQWTLHNLEPLEGATFHRLAIYRRMEMGYHVLVPDSSDAGRLAIQFAAPAGSADFSAWALGLFHGHFKIATFKRQVISGSAAADPIVALTAVLSSGSTPAKHCLAALDDAIEPGQAGLAILEPATAPQPASAVCADIISLAYFIF